MEMKFIVGLILMLILLFAGLVLISKSSGSMSGLFDGLRALLGV